MCCIMHSKETMPMMSCFLAEFLNYISITLPSLPRGMVLYWTMPE